MLSVTRADGSAERQTLELLRSRNGEVDRKVATVVTQIIETVRQEGDAALRRYAEQFDSAAPARLEVTKEEIEQALDTADADFVQALRRAKENITAFHARQKQQSFWDAIIRKLSYIRKNDRYIRLFILVGRKIRCYTVLYRVQDCCRRKRYTVI